MAILSLSSLLTRLTKSEILAKGLAVASAIGLPVTSWSVGDPTRSLYHYLAEILEILDNDAATYAASGFLDYAHGDWLTTLAYEQYDVTAREATFAGTDLTLINSSGRNYIIGIGELTAKNAVTGKTYHNIAPVTIPPGPSSSATVAIEADEAGSASSAAAGEISELVTTYLGVTCSNLTAAVGTDDEDESSIVGRCRASTGMVSPNGPRDAYVAVALNRDLTGATNVTRARSIGDSDTGDVFLYLAGPSGAITETERAAVELAIVRYAAPLTITPTVTAAEPVIVNISYSLWLYRSVGQTEAQVAATVETALEQTFRTRPIGGDVIPPSDGKLYRSLIAAEIKATFPGYVFRVEIVSPSTDVTLAQNQVAVLGVLSPTISFIEDP